MRAEQPAASEIKVKSDNIRKKLGQFPRTLMTNPFSMYHTIHEMVNSWSRSPDEMDAIQVRSIWQMDATPALIHWTLDGSSVKQGRGNSKGIWHFPRVSPTQNKTSCRLHSH
jgi:hypothetical protein